jgi:hypothetical protein
MKSLAIWSLAALSVLGACSQPPAPAATANKPPAAPPASTAAAPSQSGPQTVTGTVVETMDAANYTYVRVKTNTAEVWAATGQFKVAVGDRVTVPLEMPMQDFHSMALKRDFPLIYFTSHIDREGQSTAAMMPGHEQAAPGMMSGHPAMGGAPPAQGEATKVAPAAGGMTIADLWTKRAGLAGKNVTVRGRVVKFNGGILDRNWIHIQDGTGTAKDGSNDLTITSQDMVKVGDIITATGKVVLNKDFGAGYSYGLMVEGATIVAK